MLDERITLLIVSLLCVYCDAVSLRQQVENNLANQPASGVTIVINQAATVTPAPEVQTDLGLQNVQP